MYQYKVYTLDKQIIEGIIDAADESTAEERLHEAGYSHVLALKKAAPPFSLQKHFPEFFKVRKADITDFFGQLATLIEARVPFTQALWVLSEQAKKIAFKTLITKLGQQVSAGVPFSQALMQYPKLISSQYCQVINVSEKSGDLPRGLRLVASYMEKELSLAGNVKRMLSYPVFLALMSLAVIIIIVMVAIPSLVKFFNALHADLPATTRLFMGLANFLIEYKFHLVGGIIGIALLIIWLWKTPAVKKYLDKVLLKIPIIGSIIITRNICRICRTGSMLVEAGMTLPQSLLAISGIIDNHVIRKILSEIRQDIIKGKGLSRQMSRYPVFPKLMTDVIGIGEKTGTLQASFTSMADYYEKRLDLRVKKLLGMIEPASIVIVGIIISFIGVAIIQPLYSIYQTLPMG